MVERRHANLTHRNKPPSRERLLDICGKKTRGAKSGETKARSSDAADRVKVTFCQRRDSYATLRIIASIMQVRRAIAHLCARARSDLD